jgi:integrase
MIQYQNHLDQRDLADATIRRNTKTIKAFFNWCVRAELIDKSPANAIKARKISTKVARDKAMTDEEFEAILDYVKWKPRDYALILFLADTGCRAGGAAGLTTDHLNLPEHIAIVTEKGDRTRPVSFGHECASAISIWLLQRPGGEGDYVFSRTGRRLQSASISQVVERACLRVLGRSRGSHSLRHRKGHQMADSGVAVTIAARVLGHDSELTTLMYYPNDWGRARKVIESLAYKPGAKGADKASRIIRLKTGSE